MVSLRRRGPLSWTAVGPYLQTLRPHGFGMTHRILQIIAQLLVRSWDNGWDNRRGSTRETSALVLIGERETRTSTYGNYFVAFNYDLKSDEKTSLTSFNKGFI